MSGCLTYHEFIRWRRQTAITCGGKSVRPESRYTPRKLRPPRAPDGSLTVPALARQMGLSTPTLWQRLEEIGWAGKAVGWRTRKLFSLPIDDDEHDCPDIAWLLMEKQGPVYHNTYRLTKEAIDGGFGISVPLIQANVTPTDFITPKGLQALADMETAIVVPTTGDGVHDRIRTIRKDRPDLTQREISELAGCSRRLVSKVLASGAY